MSEQPLLTWLKSCDHQLSVKKILLSDVDEDPAFKKLDEEVMACLLAPLVVKVVPEVPLSNP